MGINYKKELDIAIENLQAETYCIVPNGTSNWLGYFSKKFILDEVEYLNDAGRIKTRIEYPGEIYVFDGDSDVSILLEEYVEDFWQYFTDNHLASLDNQSARSRYHEEFYFDLSNNIRLVGYDNEFVELVKKGVEELFTTVHNNYIFSKELSYFRGIQNKDHAALFANVVNAFANFMIAIYGSTLAQEIENEVLFNTKESAAALFVDLHRDKTSLDLLHKRNAFIGKMNNPSEVVIAESLETLTDHLRQVIQQQPLFPKTEVESFGGEESVLKKDIEEEFKAMDNRGWRYAFTSELDYEVFVNLLINHFEGRKHSLPSKLIILDRDCKTKLATTLNSIHKKLSNGKKLKSDFEYLKLIRVLNHFENDSEDRIYRTITK